MRERYFTTAMLTGAVVLARYMFLSAMIIKQSLGPTGDISIEVSSKDLWRGCCVASSRCAERTADVHQAPTRRPKMSRLWKL